MTAQTTEKPHVAATDNPTASVPPVGITGTVADTTNGTPALKAKRVVRRQPRQVRFKSREADPLKQRNPSLIDMASPDKWDLVPRNENTANGGCS